MLSVTETSTLYHRQAMGKARSVLPILGFSRRFSEPSLSLTFYIWRVTYVGCLGDAMPIEKSDLLQGTLDMLILKIVTLGPIHGYGISQRLRQISKQVLLVQ